MTGFRKGTTTGSRVGVMAVGGGACNSLANMAVQWAEGPEIWFVNTDRQALARCGAPEQRLAIGDRLTRGEGAGGDPYVGRMAAEDNVDLLRETISGMEVLFLVVTLGGGTGSGAGPVVARIAREQGVTTFAVVTLPFDCEGLRRQEIAREGLDRLRAEADLVVVLKNEHLLATGENEPIQQVFRKQDEKLAVAIHALWNMLTRPGLINLTLADLRNFAEHSGGVCTFHYGEGSGPNRVAEALARVREPQPDGASPARAEALLVSVVGGSDLALREVTDTLKQLDSFTIPHARRFQGVAIEEGWEGRFALVVLAAETWSETVTRATKPVQPELPFDSTDDLFAGAESTTSEDGTDLDVPTFMRRGIKLSFER